MTDATGRAEVATAAARAGAREAHERFRSELTVETKADKVDIVTDADHAAQRAAVDRIRAAFSAEPVVAEEDDEPGSIPETGPAWVIDPIDGTANYARGLRIWTTSVASVVDGEPVGAASILPAMDDAYTAGSTTGGRDGEGIRVSDRTDPEAFAVSVLGWGARGERSEYAALCTTVIDRFGDMRRLGSMQAALAFVASGGLDAAVATRRPNPWDSVAGARLVRSAGGTVTDADGRRWRHDSDSMVASNGRAHEALCAAARDSR